MYSIYAEKFVYPRERPLTPEEQMDRRMAHALKLTTESLGLASRALAPLVDAHDYKGTAIVLMPVPSSSNTSGRWGHIEGCRLLPGCSTSQ